MRSGRCGTAAIRTRMHYSPPVIRRALELCTAHDIASIAFPAISTGVYRFPADRAARIAVSTVVEALARAPVVGRVVFCCFSNGSAALHAEATAGFGSPCAD